MNIKNVELHPIGAGSAAAATGQAVLVQGHNPHQPSPCEPVLLTNPGPASRENTAHCPSAGGEEQRCDPCQKVFTARVVGAACDTRTSQQVLVPP